MKKLLNLLVLVSLFFTFQSCTKMDIEEDVVNEKKTETVFFKKQRITQTLTLISVSIQYQDNITNLEKNEIRTYYFNDFHYGSYNLLNNSLSNERLISNYFISDFTDSSDTPDFADHPDYNYFLTIYYNSSYNNVDHWNIEARVIGCPNGGGLGNDDDGDDPFN